MAKFRYRATKKGLLHFPYRFVEEGDIVESEVPMKASWLEAADTKTPTQAPKLLVPYMKIDGKVGRPVNPDDVVVSEAPQKPKSTVLDIAVPKAYQAQIDTLQEHEAKRDGKPEKVKPVPTADAGDVGTGTGNQDVI